MCQICLKYTCPDGCPNNFSLKKGKGRVMGRKYAIAFKEGRILLPKDTDWVERDGIGIKIFNKNTNEIRNEI